MAIFNSYVSLPEVSLGISTFLAAWTWVFPPERDFRRGWQFRYVWHWQISTGSGMCSLGKE